MPSYTFDTSVIISRKVSDIPDSVLFSAVVLLELIAGSKDESERKQYEALARDYSKDGSLIVPNFDDWLLQAEYSTGCLRTARERQVVKHRG